MEGDLATYFDVMWGINVGTDNLQAASFPTFEEALGLLELAEDRGEFFRGFGGLHQEVPRGRELQSHLITLIAIYLERRLRNPNNHHRALVDRLRHLGLLPKTAFVSLNYDILIDNALETQGSTGIDYGVPFSNHANAVRGAAVPLLKLHGSLNWLYCPTCNALDHYPEQKVAAHLPIDPHRGVCSRCQEPRVPILIPPTFFKVMSNIFLQQIWKQTEDELRRAARIIFCGYSFPDADLHVKYLLKRAEVNRNDRPPRVFVLNEHPGKTDEAIRIEQDRYGRFFREKNEVIWVHAGFQQFAEDPRVVENQGLWQRPCWHIR
jgi:hypothetical protein